LAYFAVARAADSAGFEVHRCHINLWVLGGLVGYRVAYFDVGLHVRATGGGLTALDLALPFGAIPSGFSSLRDELRDAKIANLIFADENALVGGSLVLEDKKDPVPILQIDPQRSELQRAISNRSFSAFTVGLSEPLELGQSGYLRVRFHVRWPGRMWSWRRSLLARTGAIADLRIADQRDAQTVVGDEALVARMIELAKLDAFVIAPAALQPLQASPKTEYVRLLEGQLWERYLGRATDLRRREKFLVHYWKPAHAVRLAEPFRGSLVLGREWTYLPTISDLKPVLLALLAAIALFSPRFELQWLSDAADWVGETVSENLGTFSILVAVSLVATLATLTERFRSWRTRSPGFLRRIDDFVYRHRGARL
jgi:hypothetical protein